ncbi:ABC transporter [Pelomyxa schiedti]|nr:ABC transporter [Pelomyxa schiedti]
MSMDTVVDVYRPPAGCGSMVAVGGDGSSALDVVLTWEDVSYSVVTKRCPTKSREILHGVSGYALPSTLTALLGSTGAGKSTLLDILAGWNKTGKVSGTILLNGVAPRKMKHAIGYVTQDDAFIGTQTVFETFMFYANLKLPQTLSTEAKQICVEQLIAELGLSKCRNSRIGTQFARGISGGERKRVAIGCELITNPGLILLDEPTTGLDSFNSLSVMMLLSDLAKKGKTVVCTIHQPRSLVYQLFDKVYLMSQGEMVYFGEASTAAQNFIEKGFAVPKFTNPADFLLDVVVISQESGMKSFVRDRYVQLIGGEHEKIDLTAMEKNQDTQIKQQISDLKTASPKVVVPRVGASWPKQTYLLCKRTFTDLVRNPNIIGAQLFSALFMSILVGTLYLGLGNSQNSINNRAGVLFFLTIHFAFSQQWEMEMWVNERGILRREESMDMYSTSAYFFSKVVCSFPFEIFLCLLSTCIMYYMIGLSPAPNQFALCFGAMAVATLVSSAMFSFIGVISPNEKVGMTLAPVFLIFFMICAGFFIRSSSIPPYWIWVYYISYIRYAFEIVMVNEFTGLTFTCGESVAGCLTTGEEVLLSFGLENVVIGLNFTWLLIMVFGFRAATFFALKTLHKEKR